MDAQSATALLPPCFQSYCQICGGMLILLEDVSDMLSELHIEEIAAYKCSDCGQGWVTDTDAIPDDDD